MLTLTVLVAVLQDTPCFDMLTPTVIVLDQAKVCSCASLYLSKSGVVTILDACCQASEAVLQNAPCEWQAATDCTCAVSRLMYSCKPLHSTLLGWRVICRAVTRRNIAALQDTPYDWHADTDCMCDGSGHDMLSHVPLPHGHSVVL